MNRLFNALAEEDKLAIIKRIETYAGFRGEGCKMSAPLDYVLRFWNDNKEKFYDMFGKNFIISKRIDFEKSEEEIMGGMEALLDGEGNSFCNWLYNECFWKIKTAARHNLRELLYISNLAKNKYEVGEPFVIECPNGKTIKIERGCKISRVLQKIANAFGCPSETFEKFRIAHSMVLNDKVLQGNLCLSIHPLDFMTMSDNDCNWESCMAWSTYIGEYRQGTVEMMNSPYIIMAYLDNPKPMYLEESKLKWTNKQWRQLIIVTDEVIMGIKSYPYENKDLRLAAINWLKELSKTSYYSKPITIHPFREYYYEEIKKSIYFSFSMNHMYNDITSNGHLGYIGYTENSNIQYELSGNSECLLCGEDCSDYSEDGFTTDFLGCADCLGVARCYDCGDWMYRDDMTYIDGCRYCDYCASNYITICPWCGDSLDTKEDLIELDVTLNGDHYYRTMCKTCFEEEVIESFDENEEKDKKYLDSIKIEEYIGNPTIVTINIKNWEIEVIEEVLHISRRRINQMKNLNF